MNDKNFQCLEESTEQNSFPLIDEKDRLSKYQKYHLRLMAITLLFTVITACMFIKQVMNLTEQTKRNTEVVNLQKRAVEAQTWYTIIQQMMEVDKVFVDNPDMYPYFFEGKKAPLHDEKMYAKVKTTAVMLLDFMDGFDDDYVRQLPGMGENGKYWVTWEKYFYDQFASSPVLCDSYEDITSWYVNEGVIAKAAAKGCSQSQEVKISVKNEKRNGFIFRD